MDRYFRFGDSVISDLFVVTEVKRVLLPGQSVQTLDIPTVDGQIFNGGKYSPIDYEIKILIQAADKIDLMMQTKDLKDMLFSRVPLEVAFDENKYGYGLVTDEIEIEEKTATDSMVTVKLTCYKPYFYAKDDKIFQNDKNIEYIEFENTGDLPVKPVISIGFSENADFLQLQNTITKETLLLGNYPSIEKETVDEQRGVLNDPCTTTSNWTASSVPIDSGRLGGGTLAITKNDGAGLCLGTLPSSSSTSEQWKGVQVRRNINETLDEFMCEAYFTFKSTGVNGDPSVKPSDKETSVVGGKKTVYEVRTKTLNYRNGPGKNYLLLGKLEKGYTVVNYTIVNGWLRFTDSKYNNGNPIYCNKNYFNAKTVDSQITTTKQNAICKKSTYIRAAATCDSTVLVPIYKNEVVRIISSTRYSSKDSDGVVRNWYKLATPFKGYNGYICSGNLYDLSNDIINITYDEEIETADDKTGVIEVYGMGINNERIFKFEINDSNEYYEYTQPAVYVGMNTFWKDTTVVPPPKNYTTSSNNEVKINSYLSGEKGDWNDFYGAISLSRIKTQDGNYEWTLYLRKIQNGNIVNKQHIKKIINSRATEKLAYIVLYMGTHTSMEKCCDMCLNSLTVKGLNTNYSDDVNVVQFRAGDVVDIDFRDRTVALNEVVRNDLTDIGSIFFDVDRGVTPVKIFTNDRKPVAAAALTETWLGGE